MSYVYIHTGPGDEVKVARTRSTHEYRVDIGETMLFLAPELAGRLHTALGEALASTPDDAN